MAGPKKNHILTAILILCVAMSAFLLWIVFCPVTPARVEMASLRADVRGNFVDANEIKTGLAAAVKGMAREMSETIRREATDAQSNIMVTAGIVLAVAILLYIAYESIVRVRCSAEEIQEAVATARAAQAACAGEPVCSACKGPEPDLCHFECGNVLHLKCFQQADGCRQCPACGAFAKPDGERVVGHNDHYVACSAGAALMDKNPKKESVAPRAVAEGLATRGRKVFFAVQREIRRVSKEDAFIAAAKTEWIDDVVRAQVDETRDSTRRVVEALGGESKPCAACNRVDVHCRHYDCGAAFCDSCARNTEDDGDKACPVCCRAECPGDGHLNAHYIACASGVRLMQAHSFAQTPLAFPAMVDALKKHDRIRHLTKHAIAAEREGRAQLAGPTADAVN